MNVLLSIQPKWCELIANGQKTVEVRKTRPKIETPFKCYIYCTKTKTIGDFILCKSEENAKLFGYNTAKGINKGFAKKEDIQLKGKVIGEFVCDKITKYTEKDLFYGMDEISNSDVEDNSCVDIDSLLSYKGEKEHIYGWHISDLMIYDQPKDITEFYTQCKFIDYTSDKHCEVCENFYCESNESVGYYSECGTGGFLELKKPPQSWCYVMELE